MLFRKKFRPYCYLKAKPRKILSRLIKLYSLLAYLCLTFFLVGFFIILSPYLVGESIKFLTKWQSKMQSLAFFEEKNEDKKNEILAEKEEESVKKTDLSKLAFFLRIEKIDLETKVISNVDPFDSSKYEKALKKGVAHGLGSAFPGEGKMVYIFGHSTDYIWNVETYNALFYQIKDLAENDEIVLVLGEKEYKYTVKEKKIVEKNEIGILEEIINEDVLVLQTCYPPGTSWKRLLVIAKPIIE